MKIDKKRFFVGNLPPSSTEELLIKKFGKYGNVHSVELKRRADGTTFAFLDLDINPKDAEHCIYKVSRKPWDGHEIKVELAKESFLSRLERERESARSKSVKDNNEKQLQIESTYFHKEKRKGVDHQSPKFKTLSKTTSSDEAEEKEEDSRGSIPMLRSLPSMSSNGAVSDSKDRLLQSKSSDENEEEEEEASRDNIPVFRGLSSLLKNDVKCEPEERSPKKNYSRPKIEKDMMQKFESFSNVWKDDDIQPSDDQDHGFEVKREKKKAHRQTEILSDKHKAPKSVHSKIDQHERNLVAEERRLKSIAEKKKSFLQQKQAVRAALMKIDSSVRNSKKIRLDEEEEEEEVDSETHPNNLLNFEQNNVSSDAKKGKLFNDDESEDDNDDFKIKSQFEGKKGQKLLALQARFANDKRFTLDERFYESDDNAEENTHKQDEILDEKKNQLRILGSILGQELHTSEDKNMKQKRKLMLRFDPTKADHVKYEVKKSQDDSAHEHQNETTSEKKKPSTKKTKKEKSETAESTESIPNVSKDKYYEVSDALKESLKNKNDGFSLLNLFGPSESKEKDEEYRDDMHEERKSKKQIGWSLNPFKYDSSESEDEQEQQKFAPIDKETSEHQGTWHESFFFTPNDARLKEGLQFLKLKVDNEDDFATKRRELKQIIRYKIKLNQKKLTWKKKLGGKKHKKVQPKKKKQK